MRVCADLNERRGNVPGRAIDDRAIWLDVEIVEVDVFIGCVRADRDTVKARSGMRNRGIKKPHAVESHSWRCTAQYQRCTTGSRVAVNKQVIKCRSAAGTCNAHSRSTARRTNGHIAKNGVVVERANIKERSCGSACQIGHSKTFGADVGPATDGGWIGADQTSDIRRAAGGGHSHQRSV